MKDVSTDYLKVFFHEVKISRMNDNIRKFLFMIPQDFISVHSCSDVQCDVNVRHIGKIGKRL